MTLSKLFLYLGVMLTFASFKKDKTPKLFYNDWITLKIPEPSDIALSPLGQSFYVVSDDQAAVYEIDMTGKVIRQSKTLGIELEAVCARPDFLYVVDETPRKVFQLDYNTLEVVRTFHVPYSGGRNKGFESITYNEKKKCFVLITEKDPIYIFELDADFRQINEYRWKNARDISSATYYADHVWLLSDEDMTVFKCSPDNYEVIANYKINVHNPEGIVFHDSKMHIVADDLERLYYFININRLL